MQKIKKWLTDKNKFSLFEIILNWLILISSLGFLIFTFVFTLMTKDVSASEKSVKELSEILSNYTGVFAFSFLASLSFAILFISLITKYFIKRKRKNKDRYLIKNSSKGW